jgi:hypothetical protein
MSSKVVKLVLACVLCLGLVSGAVLAVQAIIGF